MLNLDAFLDNLISITIGAALVTMCIVMVYDPYAKADTQETKRTTR